MRRAVKQIDTHPQGRLFGPEEWDTVAEAVAAAVGPVVFNRPDPREIFLGAVRLDEHLRAMGATEALRVRELLEEQSWEVFERQYKPGGRRPYAPQALLGLVLYGISKGVSSLRGLERLARVDLGCMWITGGLCPDHASIGRFIQQHDAHMSGEFLEGLTRSVLRVTASGVETVAGDGTVVQAAASRYRTLKQEAARAAAEAARAATQANPDDAKLQARAAQAEEVEETLAQRAAARQAKGKPPESASISPVEPEAVVQRQKDKKTFAPSYQPSVLANAARVIVGWDLDPSSETAVVAPMLDQAERLGGVRSALFDAGYHSDAVLATTAARGIEVLCPEGQALGEEDWTRQSDKYYPKSQFLYDPTSDSYTCPAGARLTPKDRCHGKHPRDQYIRYTTTACATCPSRAQCTRGEGGRQLKRYRGDAAKEALRTAMADPARRRRYRQRQAMVEPVFSVLKHRQGLTRFRRRGLAAVRREFALHVMAYNLGRAIARGAFSALLRALRSALGWLHCLLQRDHRPCATSAPQSA
jgi:transposase